MGKKVVTFEEMVDLAIGSPETVVDFAILKKVLKLFTRYCCKKDYTFEIDMDNLKAEVTMVAEKSRSSISISRGSSESDAYSGRSDTSNEREVKIKAEKEVKSDNEDENIHMKIDKASQVYSSEEKAYDSSTEISKQSESGTKEQSEKSDRKDSEKGDKAKEKKEKKHKKESDSYKKKDETKRKSSEKHKKKSSDDDDKKDCKKRMHALEDLNKESEKRSNELENRVTELSDRIASITETIGTHLNAEHLEEINKEIDQLKRTAEITNDQCYEAANSLNDQSSQIQEILTTINNIQLQKVENEELIDLLSGKADYSFVDEKVSTSQFEVKIQELKDVIGDSAIQLDSVRLETNTSLEEIKQELLARLLAEEFDEAKTKIYKELIKLTEQNTLILAQQNEHVAAGAKMRNLNCFVCDREVVMLLEQETIPKFRPLKASLQPLEPVVGTKLLIGDDVPEWKNHLLKTKDYTRASKASRFHLDVSYEKSTYVKGKNGCMYKGNVGCDCAEAMDAIGSAKRGKCCSNEEANNMKNISLTNQIKSESKHDGHNVIGDVVNGSCNNIDNNKTVVAQETVPMERQEDKSNFELEDVETTPEISVKVEKTVESLEEIRETVNVVNGLDATEIKNEIVTTETNNDIAFSTVNDAEADHNPTENSDTNGELPMIKTENDEPAIEMVETTVATNQ